MPKTGQRPIRLVIIDDHALFRESVARLLHGESGFEVVRQCGSGTEALESVKAWKDIDVLLLDLDLGQERGADFLDELQKADFPGKVLLVTAGVEDHEARQLIRRGVSGVFLKHGSPASLIQGIRETMEGKALFGQQMLRRIMEQEEEAASEPTRLTERERQVLAFVFEGLANKQIADRLGVSESAVKASLQQLFGKTGVRTRSQLVRVALERYRDQL
jgi:two-component system, NarL family, nitrate/nitrite response regulator NarL